jgi:hypothetical protein
MSNSDPKIIVDDRQITAFGAAAPMIIWMVFLAFVILGLYLTTDYMDVSTLLMLTSKLAAATIFLSGLALYAKLRWV